MGERQQSTYHSEDAAVSLFSSVCFLFLCQCKSYRRLKFMQRAEPQHATLPAPALDRSCFEQHGLLAAKHFAVFGFVVAPLKPRFGIWSLTVLGAAYTVQTDPASVCNGSTVKSLVDTTNRAEPMDAHVDLLTELELLDKVPTLERLRTAQKRRAQQLKKWAQYEKEMQHKKRKHEKRRSAVSRKKVSFEASVALLEASLRNDVEEEIMDSGTFRDLHDVFHSGRAGAAVSPRAARTADQQPTQGPPE
ncbi:Protein phosphatase 1 regulatory inhibitor subunit 16B [Chelonia mydas]|uniref:Protein phosphatase 1 regulatory inhibitor subunit 16B n=1 Tax=Chelonia mydas TaxID=8469 RepID=M7BR96_CHEMY|nr:Protein phosphatase 1 regulatory inhibitor subunit 16B [Chelonia mydas]